MIREGLSDLAAYVLDCSVTVSWLLPDESSDFSLLDRITERGAVVPSLWSLEVGNVLLVAERKKRITVQQRQKALYTLMALPITVDTMTSAHAWLETIELAERYGLTLYDASYLELSLRRSLPLATLDQSLQVAAKRAGVSIAV